MRCGRMCDRQDLSSGRGMIVSQSPPREASCGLTLTIKEAVGDDGTNCKAGCLEIGGCLHTK